MLEPRDVSVCPGGIPPNNAADTCGCPTGGEGGLSSWCIVPEDVCTRWVSSDAYLVSNVMPAASDATTLYAWGFAAVIGPAVVLWVAGLIVAGVRRIVQGATGRN